MEDHDAEVNETIPASRKLGQERAEELIAGARKIIVSKGKRVRTFDPATDDHAEIIKAMLGTTGNLRAPTAVVGDTVLVGFNNEPYTEILG